MANAVNPTKANLMAAKKSLALAQNGYELLDRKRNILVRETMAFIDRANTIQGEIDRVFHEAYEALRLANVTLGVCDDLAQAVPVETGLSISARRKAMRRGLSPFNCPPRAHQRISSSERKVSPWVQYAPLAQQRQKRRTISCPLMLPQKWGRLPS